MAEKKDLVLEIARVIGQPIDPNLKVPVAIDSVCDVEYADPGEDIKTYGAADTEVDEVYEIAANGDITVLKITPMNAAALTFTGLNSKLYYVLVDDILNKTDTDALGRKKAGITRSMDKEEVKRLCAGIYSASGITEVSKLSGEDLLDVLVKAKHALEDYGDNYVLFAGSAVKEAIDKYDKEKASTYHYRLIGEWLTANNVKVVKIFGKVNGAVLLHTDKFIMFAIDSTIAQGKPCLFVRRRISPEIAEQMGVEVDAAQRALLVNPTPVIDTGTNKLAYGAYGYESIVLAIINKLAIVRSADII